MDKEQLQKVIASSKYVLLDFYATWCMPCKMQTEILKELNNSPIDNLSINKIDVDESMDLVKEFKIVSVPTLVMYKDGEIVKRYVGVAKLDDIKQWMK